jgi:hypothetical protein
MVKRAIIQRGEALQQIKVERPGTPYTALSHFDSRGANGRKGMVLVASD